MAGKGTYAAYAPIKGVGEQTTDNLRQAEYAGFRYRAEEVARKERKNKFVDDILEKTGATRDNLVHKNTGVQGWDVPATNFFSEQISEVNELEEQILKEGTRNPETLIKLNRINGAAKTIKQFSQVYEERKAGFNPDTDSAYHFEKQTAAINDRLKQGKYKFFKDKNQKINAIFHDDEGEIDPDLPVLNITDIADNGLPPIPGKVTRKSAIEAIAPEFGKLTSTEDLEGNITEKFTGFNPENIPALRERTDEYLGDNVSSMTQAAESILYNDLGRDPSEEITDKEFEAFKDDFANSIVRMADKTESTTEDRNLTQRQREFGYRVGQDKLDREEKAAEKAAKDAEENPPSNPDRIEVMTGEDGGTIAENGNTLFSLPQSATLETGSGTVNSFQVEMGDNEINFSGTMTGKNEAGKSVTSKTKITRDDQKNTVVRAIPNPDTGKNFTGLSEFYSHLNKIKDTQGLPDL